MIVHSGIFLTGRVALDYKGSRAFGLGIESARAMLRSRYSQLENCFEEQGTVHLQILSISPLSLAGCSERLARLKSPQHLAIEVRRT